MTDTATRSREGVLTLLSLEGVGVKTAGLLASSYETLDAVRDAAAKGPVPGLRRTPESLSDPAAWRDAHARVGRVLEQAFDLGISVLSLYDEGFPALLRCIPDPPPVLYVKGRLPAGDKSVACIGTREPTTFGVCVTQRLVRLLADAGWSIVSGLAIGVDTEAHREALAAKGHTVAILANGLDKVYPRENKKLAEDILASGGALVSEQPVGATATASNLVQRDRLQSGMSLATFVMQTDLVGGSMHTVRYTLTQGHLLYAPVPTGGHAEEAKSQGILALTADTGPVLAGKLRNPPPDYCDLLRSRFREHPPARPIRSREDYPAVLRELEEALQAGGTPSDTAAGVPPEAPPADPPHDSLF